MHTAHTSCTCHLGVTAKRAVSGPQWTMPHATAKQHLQPGQLMRFCRNFLAQQTMCALSVKPKDEDHTCGVPTVAGQVPTR